MESSDDHPGLKALASIQWVETGFKYRLYLGCLISIDSFGASIEPQNQIAVGGQTMEKATFTLNSNLKPKALNLNSPNHLLGA